MGTAIVGSILVGVVAIIIKNMIRDKKMGKSLQCGCNCKNCSGHCQGKEHNEYSNSWRAR